MENTTVVTMDSQVITILVKKIYIVLIIRRFWNKGASTFLYIFKSEQRSIQILYVLQKKIESP